MTGGWRGFGKRALAGTVALMALFLLLLGPMAVYRFVTGSPLTGPGTGWEVWLLILGGAVGAGAARWVHWLFLTRIFKYSSRDADRAWRREQTK